MPIQQKNGPVRTVRWILDFAFYTGGTMSILGIVLLIVVSLAPGSRFDSETPWPVWLHISGFTQIPLTRVEVNRPAGSQVYVEAHPRSVNISVAREHSDFTIVGFNLVWYVLSYGTFFLIVYLLRKIFLRMEANEFFDPQTPDRLRMLGWIIVVSSLMRSLATYLFGRYASSLLNSVPESRRAALTDAMGRPMPMYIKPVIDLAPEMLFLGLVMFALAIAFQKGLDLKQEQSLTV